MQNNTCNWTIVEKKEEAPLVSTLFLRAESEQPNFIAGQYLTVQLPGFEPAEGKSYSISSAPHDPLLTLTIKEMGNFSRALLAHEVGTILTTSTPYGFFYPDEPRAPHLIFIAGGIGITPCMSMIRSLLHTAPDTHITLLYSNRTEADIIFKDTLTTLASNHPTFSIHHFLTREDIVETDTQHRGRLTEASLVEYTKIPEADYFLCGSMDFTKSLWSHLRTLHIPSTKIYTEGFF
ncbi:hypothetical protein IPH92_02870 [Candidatus Kaiserbacteria bacterium]|nr:MAG: hypothetical protein IPH92_02870 [Candidatus Kaiserbacteria bacterium]